MCLERQEARQSRGPQGTAQLSGWRAGYRQATVGTAVLPLMKRPHGLGRHALQAAGCTQDGSAVGVLVTALAQQELQHLLIGLIGVLSDLLEHHPPFRVETVRLEAWL